MKYTLKESLNFQSHQLVSIFNDLFEKSHQTILVGGASEPEYIPTLSRTDFHRIFFVGDSFASALHEISHWLVAGAERRKLRDYGYWYAPDGRDLPTQKQFEEVEAKNQSLEWILASACEMDFYISLDNLQGETVDVEGFRQRVQRMSLGRITGSHTERTQRMLTELIARFSSTSTFNNYWSLVPSKNILPKF